MSPGDYGLARHRKNLKRRGLARKQSLFLWAVYCEPRSRLDHKLRSSKMTGVVPMLPFFEH